MANAKYNAKLFSLVMSSLSGLDKQSFTPMPPGGDPSQGGGQPPMGAPPQGQPQMDPGMMAAMQQGGDPSQGQPQPGMAPDGLPANAPPPEEEGKADKGDGDVQDQIRSVLTEAGVIKPPKLKPEDHFLWTKAAIEKICTALGIKPPPLPDTSNMSMNKGAGGGGGGSAPAMTAGMSGGPSSQALGSMDNAPLDPSQAGGAPMAKQADISGKAASIREALARFRK